MQYLLKYSIIVSVVLSLNYYCGCVAGLPVEKVKTDSAFAKSEKIWDAIQLYEELNKKPPASLDELVESGLISDDLLMAPDGKLFAAIYFVDNEVHSDSKEVYYYLYCVDQGQKFVRTIYSFEYPWLGRRWEEITVEGYAFNERRGAFLFVEPNAKIWIDGLEAWDKASLDALLNIKGKVVESMELTPEEKTEREWMPGFIGAPTGEQHLRIIDWELSE
ncbi:hypothetical protein [Coraliomargarita parva]|uniref:hypothetical protein n=1 Tax=Coraliomargarita parva TaxID=3014050 RepID=UPI0022B35892|nr:hypothetical protein [Coraliomargarita parva]